MTLKALDEKLIKVLGTDARQSSEKVAKKLHVSPTTVRRRLKTLSRSGMLQTAAVVNPAKAGLTLQTIIGLNVSHDSSDAIVLALERSPDITWIATTTGRYDILVKAAFKSTGELSEFIQTTLAGIKGIKDSETFICLDVVKGVV